MIKNQKLLTGLAMNRTPITQQLTDLFVKEEKQLVSQQDELIFNQDCPSIENSDFYVKTLANLQLYNDASVSNVQLRELYYYKTKMLKKMIADVSLQLVKFKNSVQAYYAKLSSKNPS